ncbi:hypothetical protein H112_07269 [Trichophyton rubrum D6]|uniref:Uncharacterized protein n=3 Tax=Trichophyton TaxID=5550 RepID=A0A080WLC3_TRIRC|nr:uncharacterized protein TERG_11866 [Trichophyton rubrum CBS 118892]EZF11743.1 hypothetical protein H100_07295 [Trichophyton rubrum MR850]EZF38629.1 hypothetical protein H102_07256 [Trichophyton rubrum CBS 100081]EZF49155.1 hypothetical protein H103_07278 [Trichophyton rubrum CBS 288.86]EZF59800.1 hypothetical protein H104_07231 [Trichophyton rubrum CBS 289.86]EZF70482.1 hypothetical protein H105_07293 [Trichophyton soudanense CBS 452.61]EZF81088.1 hypothetical protein H110_07277 [Trichophy
MIGNFLVTWDWNWLGGSLTCLISFLSSSRCDVILICELLLRTSSESLRECIWRKSATFAFPIPTFFLLLLVLQCLSVSMCLYPVTSPEYSLAIREQDKPSSGLPHLQNSPPVLVVFSSLRFFSNPSLVGVQAQAESLLASIRGAVLARCN